MYKNDGPFDVYISTSNVPELYTVEENTGEITLGANVSLKRAIEVFEEAAGNPGFQHLKELAKHWGVVANVAVRNVSLWLLRCFLTMLVFVNSKFSS